MAQIPVAPNAGHLAARLEAQAGNPEGAVAAQAPVLPAVSLQYKLSKSNRLNRLPRFVVNFVLIHARVGGFSMLPGQLCRMSGPRLFSVVSLQLVVSFSPMFVVTSAGCAPFSLLTTRAVFQRTCVCVFPCILFSLPPLGEFVIRLFLLSLPGERHFTFRV